MLGNRPHYVENHGVLSLMTARFRDFDHLTRLAQRMAEGVGRRVGELSPTRDARPEEYGFRVDTTVPPLANRRRQDLDPPIPPRRIRPCRISRAVRRDAGRGGTDSDQGDRSRRHAFAM